MTLKIIFALFFFLQQICCQDEGEVMLNDGQKWGFGLLTSFGVAMIGFAAAIFLVLIGSCTQSDNFKGFVKGLFALSCGALIGDSMVHILSEAYASTEVEAIFVSLVVCLSLLTFTILERVMEKFGITHNHWVDDHQHGSSNKKENIKVEIVSPEGKVSLEASSMALQPQTKRVDVQETPNPKEQGSKDQGCFSSWKNKGSAGYMNLVGSLIHNLVDGISIGIAFSTGDKHIYIPVVIAIFAHQIPRELGDVAILLESHFTGKQAILSNGIINLVSIIGAVIGLATANVSHSAQTYLMVFVAGNFIYIAADIWRQLFKSTWCQNVVQFLFFCAGLGIMFGIKFIEGQEAH